MFKSVLFLCLGCLLATSVLADRPDISATIPDSFWLEIALKQDTQNTRQKLFINKGFNKAKSAQTIDMGETEINFITIADFTLNKVSVYNGMTKSCDISELGAAINFVDTLRAIFNDPGKSPWQEDKGMNLFTVNWASIEGVDDWTHFYFDKATNKLALLEHYFKESSPDPWIAFDILTPISPQDFEESEFINPDCPFPAEEKIEF